MAILIWNMTINYWSPSSLFCDVMIVMILAHKNTPIHYLNKLEYGDMPII